MAFSISMNTCDMENRPIMAQVTLMPLYRASMPNIYRSTPSMGSMPMVDSIRPNAPDIRPLTIDPEVTPAIMVRPNSASQKYSGLPNFMASWANAGAKKYREIQLSSPPKKEAVQAVPSALPALPFRVS